MAVFETPYLHLEQPLPTDYVDVSVWNSNMDKIDAFASSIGGGQPVEIPSSANLNAYIDAGTYVSNTAEITDSLLNTPQSVLGEPFLIKVFKYAGNLLQIVMSFSSTTLIPEICVRAGKQEDETFGLWYSVTSQNGDPFAVSDVTAISAGGVSADVCAIAEEEE